MNTKLIDMLRTNALAEKSKALLTLDLLGNKGAGIGDHSTGDFYKNAEEALSMLVDADDKLSTLTKYFPQSNVGKPAGFINKQTED